MPGCAQTFLLVVLGAHLWHQELTWGSAIGKVGMHYGSLRPPP